MNHRRRARGTGTIERRARAGKIRYYARLPGAAQRPLPGFFDTWDEADAALDEARKLITSGVAKDRKSLEAFGFEIIGRRERDGYRNSACDRRRWRAYVTPWECAAWTLDHVKRRHVSDWIRHLRAQGLADQTVTNALNLLRAVFRAAIEEELIEANPCTDVRVKKTGRTAETSTFLSIDELAALFWSADDEGKHVIAFDAGSGLRQGELRSLLEDDVHLDGDRPHAIVRFGAPGKPTKSGKIRRVPLFGLALAAAKSWKANYGSRAAKEGPRYFFSTVTGRALAHSHIFGRHGARWHKWLRRAGIARRVRFHDLRHTCATLLLTGKLSAAPWTLEAVKEMLGHSSITTTERYAKATGSLAEDAARGPFPSSIAAASSELPTFYQLPNADPLSARFWSRIQALNSGAEAIKTAGLFNRFEGLDHGVGLAVLILQRAASVGDVSRYLVEQALNVIDAAEASAHERATLP